jgi:hypothetical protein
MTHHIAMEIVSTRMARPLLIGLVGVTTGVVTVLGQGVLDAQWNRLANSGAIWLLVAFLVGSIMPTRPWAAAAGVGTLVGAVIGYYVAAVAIAGASASPGSLVIWTGTALVGGPVYGLAGRLWREPEPRPRALAIALMGGVFCAEGLFTLVRIPDLAAVGWVELAGGVVLTFALGRSSRDRSMALAMLPFVVLAGFIALSIIDRLFAGG